MGFERFYTDPDGQDLLIRESADHPGAALLLPGDFEGFAVPAHRLAEFCGYLYEAAGQPVPDLPQIFDPAAVDELAKLLRYAQEGITAAGRPDHKDWARVLLAHGWSKTA